MTFSSIPSTSDEPSVVLSPVPRAEALTLRNLYERYAYDFSELMSLPINSTGRFDVMPGGDAWWSNDTHHAFFIRKGEILCGFALARKGSRISDNEDLMDVADFFVLRGERRRNVGVRAAHLLLDSFPGRWEIRVRKSNAPALAFWSRVVHSNLGRRGVECVLLRGLSVHTWRAWVGRPGHARTISADRSRTSPTPWPRARERRMGCARGWRRAQQRSRRIRRADQGRTLLRDVA